MPAAVQTECLVQGGLESEIEVHVRFLHLVRREVGEFASPMTELPAGQEPAYTKVASLKVGEEVFQSWEEAIERDVTASSVTLKQLIGCTRKDAIRLCRAAQLEALARAGRPRVRSAHPYQRRHSRRADDRGRGGCARRVPAHGADRQCDATRRHRVQRAQRRRIGAPLLRPIQSLVCAAARSSRFSIRPANSRMPLRACNNQGTWPVLAGEEGTTDTILSSPIILYDYPQVAPESPGDLFDATEIDEILTLRILAMTDEEKRDMAALDARARALLERTQALTAADMARLHGARRELRSSADRRPGTLGTERPPACKPELAFLHAGGRGLAVGDRVRLRPKGRADIFDLVLKDEMAVIEAIERDFDDKVHVAVVLEADPGREFGLDRMPGHRFFFSPDEIEPVGKES